MGKIKSLRNLEKQVFVSRQENEQLYGNEYEKLLRQLSVYGLSEEENNRLLDEYKHQLKTKLSQCIVDGYLNKKENVYRMCKVTTVIDSIGGVLFFGLSALNANFYANNPIAIALMAAISCGFAGALKLTSAILNKNKANAVKLEVGGIYGTWDYVKEELIDLLDFCKVNDIVPINNPFEPLKLEYLNDKRKDKTKLKSPLTLSKLINFLDENEG